VPIYRVSFVFSGGGEGWTETHLMQSAQTNLDALRASLSVVAQLRANLLGDPFYVYAIRLAKYLTDAGTRDVRGVRIWKGDVANGWAGWYNVNAGKANNGSEPSVVALQAVGYASATTPAPFTGNQNQTFLGGPPDAVVDNDGSVYPDKLGYGPAFNIWAGKLVNPADQNITAWGWGAATQLDNVPLDTATQNLNGTVQLVAQGPLAGTYAINTTYPARIRGVNQGHAALNGECLLSWASGTTFNTKEVIGIPTAQVGGAIRIYKPTPTFVPYGAIFLSLVSVKHKRGKSPSARPGRARRRIRG
jgi:hypothetical protein